MTLKGVKCRQTVSVVKLNGSGHLLGFAHNTEEHTRKEDDPPHAV